MTTRSVHGLDARILRRSEALAHTCRTEVLSPRTEVLTRVNPYNTTYGVLPT